MPASQFKQGEPKRKENIPSDVRTPGKDDAAEFIEQLVSNGQWPMDIKDIADKAGWSRQHIANTLEDYFETGGNVGGNENQTNETERVTPPKSIENDAVYIDIPPSVENVEDYIRGYFAGWLDGRDQESL